LSYKCDSEQTPRQRYDICQKDGRCFICFRKHTNDQTCPSKYRCQNCKGTHATVLCFRAGSSVNMAQADDFEEFNILNIDPEVYYAAVGTSLEPPIQVNALLAGHLTNGLYDSGSNIQLLTTSLCKKYNISFKRLEMKFTQSFGLGKAVGVTIVHTQIGLVSKLVHYYVLDNDTDLFLLGRGVIRAFQLEQTKDLEVYQVLPMGKLKISFEGDEIPKDRTVYQ